MLESFWKMRPREDALLSSTLAELTTILTTAESASPPFISELLTKLISIFGDHTLATQLSLLCLINKCFTFCDEPLRDGEVSNTFRILKRLFEVSTKLLENKEESARINSVLNVASCIITTVITRQQVEIWAPVMDKEMIPAALVLIANIGITVRFKVTN